MLHIRFCLIHKGSLQGKHLHKGLFQVHLFLGRWFAHSGWWHVGLIVPPSITLTALIILIITPPLALILVLIVVAPILTLLLWPILIKPRHILSMLYFLLSQLTFCIVVLSVDPTQSTGQRDSLLNEKRMWVDFRILENPSPRRNSFSLESPLTFVVIL